MRVQFERFTEAHITAAVQLAVSELEAERKHCHDLPRFEFEERLKQILWWLSNQNFGGKAALCDGKLVGYLLFAGPWEGMFGNVKGVFSPLGGSAFSYEYENRDKLASMLFAAVAQELVAEEIFSCALSRYAHDEVVAKSFVLNGFGIRCMDAVRSVEALEKQNIQNAFDGMPFSRVFESVSSVSDFPSIPIQHFILLEMLYATFWMNR